MKVSYYLGIMLFLLSLLSIFLGINFYFNIKVVFVEWEVFSFFSSSIIMILLFDWISLLFLGFVLFISSMVLIYRNSYITSDKYIYRFITLVYLFVISMLLLILSPNLIRILLGWDGLGLVSYCLVIYYQNVKSANAGILTILSNRLGDVALLLCIAWIIDYGSWNFYYLQFIYRSNELIFVKWIVFLAALTKRAQIPFSAWLPAAIAAPTPVSALVHSSTLVTAGVYLLIRFSFLLNINYYLFYLGCLTIFMSGLGANYETDLKKIIALSTLRQLGVIIFTLSLGYYELSFFHLLSHALFKSLLFLCAGVFIHGMGDIQDIRHFGGTLWGYPIRSFYFIVCSLSLCGFPFLSGFYSKDLILEIYFSSIINLFIVFVVLLGTFFTITYSVRLIYFLYFKNLGVKSSLSLEEDYEMFFPISILFFSSVVAGSILSWINFPCIAIFLSLSWKLVLLCLTFFLSIFIYLLINQLIFVYFDSIINFTYFVGLMWFLPFLSTFTFMPLLKLGNFFTKYLDQGWVEYIGGQGTNLALSLKSSKIDYNYFFNLKIYLFIFLVLILISLFYLYLYSLKRAWVWSSQCRFILLNNSLNKV